MRDLKELLLESGCSSEFILDAMRFEHLFTGDIDAFLDKVEDILMNEDEYEEEIDEDDEFDEDEDDPISRSDYNYDGNEDNIYFEDEDGEEAFEDDEDEE
ncbi:MAG: hypothetical protein H6Q35_191 [Proteobacteria bacterium]|nr:hypothetical protein [Pseudomonadota bacterium]